MSYFIMYYKHKGLLLCSPCFHSLPQCTSLHISHETTSFSPAIKVNLVLTLTLNGPQSSLRRDCVNCKAFPVPEETCNSHKNTLILTMKFNSECAEQ